MFEANRLSNLKLFPFVCCTKDHLNLLDENGTKCLHKTQIRYFTEPENTYQKKAVFSQKYVYLLIHILYTYKNICIFRCIKMYVYTCINMDTWACKHTYTQHPVKNQFRKNSLCVLNDHLKFVRCKVTPFHNKYMEIKYSWFREEKSSYLLHHCHRARCHGNDRSHCSGIVGFRTQLNDLLQDVYSCWIQSFTLSERQQP